MNKPSKPPVGGEIYLLREQYLCALRTSIVQDCSVGTFQWHLTHVKEAHTFDQVTMLALTTALSQAVLENLAMKQQVFPSSHGRLLISFSNGFSALLVCSWPLPESHEDHRADQDLLNVQGNNLS